MPRPPSLHQEKWQRLQEQWAKVWENRSKIRSTFPSNWNGEEGTNKLFNISFLTYSRPQVSQDTAADILSELSRCDLEVYFSKFMTKILVFQGTKWSKIHIEGQEAEAGEEEKRRGRRWNRLSTKEAAYRRGRRQGTTRAPGFTPKESTQPKPTTRGARGKKISDSRRGERSDQRIREGNSESGSSVSVCTTTTAPQSPSGAGSHQEHTLYCNQWSQCCSSTSPWAQEGHGYRFQGRPLLSIIANTLNHSMYTESIQPMLIVWRLLPSCA